MGGSMNRLFLSIVFVFVGLAVPNLHAQESKLALTLSDSFILINVILIRLSLAS